MILSQCGGPAQGRHDCELPATRTFPLHAASPGDGGAADYLYRIRFNERQRHSGFVHGHMEGNGHGGGAAQREEHGLGRRSVRSGRPRANSGGAISVLRMTNTSGFAFRASDRVAERRTHCCLRKRFVRRFDGAPGEQPWCSRESTTPLATFRRAVIQAPSGC